MAHMPPRRGNAMLQNRAAYTGGLLKSAGAEKMANRLALMLNADGKCTWLSSNRQRSLLSAEPMRSICCNAATRPGHQPHLQTEVLGAFLFCML